MRTQLIHRSPPIAAEIQGNSELVGATDCTTVHSRVARAIWRHKTAEHWAVEAGVRVRMAKYWLAGRPTSAAGKLALIRQLH